jgi:hypothetical protein
MNQQTVAIINWFCLMLLLPAAAILPWKFGSVTLRAKGVAPNLKALTLLLASTVIGVTIGTEAG